MRMPDVAWARAGAVPRPTWAAIMTKAFAIAARNHPEMRQVWLGFPWPHVGEFAWQAACVIVTRRIGGEEILFTAPLDAPEKRSLAELDRKLRWYQEEPVENISVHRDILIMARLPSFIRRFLLWFVFQVKPRYRMRYFGTFGVTTMSPYGAKTTGAPCFWTSMLHYGPVSSEGDVAVGVFFDHRVMDGSVVGYTLLEMEQVLHRALLAELQAMGASRAAC